MNKIVLISGDPNSINSEIIYKTWKKLNKSLRRKIYIISNYDLLKKQFNYPSLIAIRLLVNYHNYQPS